MRYQPSRVLDVSNVLQPGLKPGCMLTAMRALCVDPDAPDALPPLALALLALLALPACGTLQAPPISPEPVQAVATSDLPNRSSSIAAPPSSAPSPSDAEALPRADGPRVAGTAATPQQTPELEPRAPIAEPPAPLLPGSASALPPVVAARFPDPVARYRTPGLADGRSDWTRAGEMTQWMRELSTPSARSAGPAPSTTGRSSGPALRASALQLSAPGAVPYTAWLLTSATPKRPTKPSTQAPPSVKPEASAPAPTWRPTVLLESGPEASAASEALLVVARELAKGKLRPLLARINVLVAPAPVPDLPDLPEGNTASAKPAGPESYIGLNTPRTQMLAKLAHEQDAVIVLTAEEAPALRPVDAQLGAQVGLSVTDMVVDDARAPSLPEFLTKASEEWFRKPMLGALQTEGLRAGTGSWRPQDSATATALKNRIGLRLVTLGSDLGRAHAQRRVHAQVTAITSVLQSTARRASELAELKPYLDREVSAQACRQLVAIDDLPQRETPAMTLLDLQSGAELDLVAPEETPPERAPPRSRIKPCGYWLAANATTAIERLRLHGVTVMRVAEPASFLGDRYRPQQPSPGSGPEGAMALTRGVIDAPTDSFFVPVDQPLGNLIVAVLEPDAPHSFAAQGWIDVGDGLARIMAPPAVRLEVLP